MSGDAEQCPGCGPSVSMSWAGGGRYGSSHSTPPVGKLNLQDIAAQSLVRSEKYGVSTVQ